jgi:CRP/FNR family transcriptional regulator, cyclic AMP receptor protein
VDKISSSTTTERLLDLDTELGALLTGGRIRAAREELTVQVHALPIGEWSAARLETTSPDHVGLLVAHGVLCREVLVADTISAELLGPGDVVRPWQLRPDAGLVPLRVRWRALAPCRVAVLDRRIGGLLGRYPEVNAVLLDRFSERAGRLATTQAISQLTRVDRRLLALLWHLAERWGRVGQDGVMLPLTLSHELLGELVGARRPTVSASLAELAGRGEVVRQDDGTWLLCGRHAALDPPPGGAATPLRRRFLQVPAPGAPNGSHTPPAHEPVPTGAHPSEALAEMAANLERIKRSWQAQVEELQRACDLSTELRTRAAQLRERRVAGRTS